MMLDHSASINSANDLHSSSSISEGSLGSFDVEDINKDKLMNFMEFKFKKELKFDREEDDPTSTISESVNFSPYSVNTFIDSQEISDKYLTIFLQELFPIAVLQVCS